MLLNGSVYGSAVICPLSPVLFNILLDNIMLIMQKILTPRLPSGEPNDCFANDAVEDAEETDIPHCRQCPSEDDRFATCGLLTTSIHWEAVKQNSNNSHRDRRKQLLYTGRKSAPSVFPQRLICTNHLLVHRGEESASSTLPPEVNRGVP